MLLEASLESVSPAYAKSAQASGTVIVLGPKTNVATQQPVPSTISRPWPGKKFD
jgi:hypothetical protein